MAIDENSKFAVVAEVSDISKPLYLTELTFARLMDDVVVPYQKGERFFVDGVPVEAKALQRIKIVLETQDFRRLFHDLHRGLRTGDAKLTKTYGDQYSVRLDAAFRLGEDVTSQAIKAFEAEIEPSLSDYLPKRKELIQAAWSVFLTAIKQLGNAN